MTTPARSADILKRLAKGPAEARSGVDGHSLWRHNIRLCRIDDTELDRLKSSGLISNRNGWLTLTQAGRTALRRSRAEESERAAKTVLAMAKVRDPLNGELVAAQVNLKESPLGWLASRKDKTGKPLLDEAQLRAGEKLRSDFEFARLGPQVSKGWRVEQGAGRNCGRGRKAGADLSDNVLAARDRVDRMLRSLDPGLRTVVVDVCCRFKGLETVERERGWPARSARIVLLLALTSLARAYGFEMQPEDGTVSG